jgi:hypothetical protein
MILIIIISVTGVTKGYSRIYEILLRARRIISWGEREKVVA